MSTFPQLGAPGTCSAQMSAELLEAIRRNESKENLFEVAAKYYEPAVVGMLTGEQEGRGGPLMGIVPHLPEGQILVINSFVTIYYNESGHQVHEYKSLDDLLTTPFACFSPALQSAMKMGEERPWKADGLPHEFPPVVYFKVR